MSEWYRTNGYNPGYKRGIPVRGTACGGFLTWTALYLLEIPTLSMQELRRLQSGYDNSYPEPEAIGNY